MVAVSVLVLVDRVASKGGAIMGGAGGAVMNGAATSLGALREWLVLVV